MQRSQPTGPIILAVFLTLILWGLSPALAQQVQVDTQQGKVGETVTFAAPPPRAYKGRFFVSNVQSGGYDSPSPLAGEGRDEGGSQKASAGGLAGLPASLSPSP